MVDIKGCFKIELCVDRPDFNVCQQGCVFSHYINVSVGIATTCIVTCIFIFLNKVIVVTYHWVVNFLCVFYMLYISVIKWQVVKTYLSNMTLYWHHIDLDKSTINILLVFFLNILFEMCFSTHLTSQASPLIWYCSEKSILAKQINDSIYIYIYICVCVIIL